MLAESKYANVEDDEGVDLVDSCVALTSISSGRNDKIQRKNGMDDFGHYY
jgi:hypothetical protein